jgi:hypothetical protein
LHSSQLPPVAAAADRGREFVQRLLNGSPPPLPAVPQQQLEWFDTQLDADQRAAVCMALNTPDGALIQGFPGTGKSRVIAEVIRLAVRHGQRILLVAPSPAALDVVLERLADQPEVLPLRYLGQRENPRNLPRCTWRAYEKQIREDAVQQAEQYRVETEKRLTNLQADDVVLTRLAELAGRREELLQEIQELQRRRDCIPEDIRQLAGGSVPGASSEHELAFSQSLRQLELQRQRSLEDNVSAEKRARSQLLEAQSAVEQISRQIQDYELLNDSAKHKHWLSPSWWARNRKAKQLGDIDALVRQEQGRLETARQRLQCEQEGLQRCEQDRGGLEQEWHHKRNACIADEISRRQILCDGDMAGKSHDLAVLEDKWRQAERELSPESPRPKDCCLCSQDACRSDWHQRVAQLQADVDFARNWVDALRQNADLVLARLRQAVNVLAVPLSACGNDEFFTEAGSRSTFDLLIVDEAHRLGEQELIPLTRLASRWILVGEPRVDDLPDAHASRSGNDSGRNRGGVATMTRSRSKATAKSSIFAKLWSALHWPIWHHEGPRLSCRLMPLTSDQRRRLEVEPVADSPDTELHILCSNDDAPSLAEVTFPATLPLPQAKSFIFRELSELPVPYGSSRWEEDGTRIRCIWTEEPTTQCVELADGVCEHYLSREPGRTAALEFNAAEGWDRARAEKWVQQHARPADLGRTVHLRRWHRPALPLAVTLGNLGFAHSVANSSHAAQETHGIEFVPVPGLSGDGSIRRRGEPASNGTTRKLPPLRGGAGFELNLADARQREKLPPELRSLLPDNGIVNLVEANAILRLLENQLETWSRAAPGMLDVAVLALYTAQAELIRQLLRLEAIAIPQKVRLTIDAAGEFRQRECDLAVISLTRSHERRAVTFGDDPALIVQALHRARQRVILVGDPGTLCRRAQWEGPLDHLDDTLALREKNWIAELVKHLQGSVPASIYLHEGPP